LGTGDVGTGRGDRGRTCVRVRAEQGPDPCRGAIHCAHPRNCNELANNQGAMNRAPTARLEQGTGPRGDANVGTGDGPALGCARNRGRTRVGAQFIAPTHVIATNPLTIRAR